jgi:hypothetical protein
MSLSKSHRVRVASFRFRDLTEGDALRAPDGRVGDCKNLQAVWRQAATGGSDRTRCMTTDPDIPGSSVLGLHFLVLEGLAPARAWGFESPISHHNSH